MLNDDILLNVSKPARYIGGEINSIIKDDENIKCRIALCFPDIYDVGMSHLGLKILYSILNERQEVACERAFAPWHDMENIMRQKGIPLFTLETKRPLKEFDIVGFSLQYELSYTNVLNMLDLGGIPIFSSQRKDSHPLIIGGGPCAFNSEPIADFFDCFVIGDAEDVILEIVDIFIEHRKTDTDKVRLLQRLAGLEGIYVPSISSKVRKRSILNLDETPYPIKPIVPYVGIVHDRMQLEVMRGCRRKCRFCQAGVIYRPNRERSVKRLISLAKSLYENTGHDEFSLISLSSGDHSRIKEIVSSLKDVFKEKGISISLPSLRAEDLIKNFPIEIASGRRTGLTFAPEVGSQKMRGIINKDISIEALKECIYQAFKNGWRRVKLYFMIGLPHEDYSDLDAIVNLAKEVSEIKIKINGRPADINASVSVFVPKPHTQFERVAMLSIGEIRKRQNYIRHKAVGSRVKFSFHDAEMSYIEAVLTRGDRRLSVSIYNAWKNGCKFDAWSDHFNFDTWMAAFKEAGIEADYYALRERRLEETLPWEFIEVS